MKKQIAVALAATLLIGSVPVWTEGATATAAAEQRGRDQVLRDSIDRAVARTLASDPAKETTAVARPEARASGPELTAHERRDLEGRRDALRTDPVARGAGGVILMLLGTAASIALTVYLIHQNQNKADTPPPAMAGR